MASARWLCTRPGILMYLNRNTRSCRNSLLELTGQLELGPAFFWLDARNLRPGSTLRRGSRRTWERLHEERVNL